MIEDKMFAFVIIWALAIAVVSLYYMRNLVREVLEVEFGE